MPPKGTKTQIQPPVYASTYSGIPYAVAPEATVNPWDITVLRQDWEAKTYKIWQNGRDVSMDCKVYGAFSVHVGYDAKEQKYFYCLTHMPTRNWVVEFYSEEETCLLAEALWEAFPLAFRSSDKNQVLDKLPTWVHWWMAKCRNMRRRLPHQPLDQWSTERRIPGENTQEFDET